MIIKYKKEFEEIYQKVMEERGQVLDVVKEYAPIFREEGIGSLGIIHYFAEYIRKR